MSFHTLGTCIYAMRNAFITLVGDGKQGLVCFLGCEGHLELHAKYAPLVSQRHYSSSWLKLHMIYRSSCSFNSLCFCASSFESLLLAKLDDVDVDLQAYLYHSPASVSTHTPSHILSQNKIDWDRKPKSSRPTVTSSIEETDGEKGGSSPYHRLQAR